MKQKRKYQKNLLFKTSQQEKLPFDHVLASSNLLQKAKDDFKEGLHKDAYGKVSQALRLFLSHELNLNKETTNEDILLHLKNTKYPIEDIENCFDTSSLVEFAKHQSNKDEFERLITLAENVIRKNTTATKKNDIRS